MPTHAGQCPAHVIEVSGHLRVVGTIDGVVNLQGAFVQGKSFCRPAEIRKCAAPMIQGRVAGGDFTLRLPQIRT